MDVSTLKAFMPGTAKQRVTEGNLFPGLGDEEVNWTTRSVVDGIRQKGNRKKTFRVVEFDLDWLGVSIGALRASESADGAVLWETIE